MFSFITSKYHWFFYDDCVNYSIHCGWLDFFDFCFFPFNIFWYISLIMFMT